jgi:hypothetical protein
MNPRVKAVVARDDYKLVITFTNQEVGIFDCAHLLTFGVFQELEDICYFRRARARHGTVVWPHEQDICPDTLYQDSVKLAPASDEQTHAPEPAAGPDSDGESSPPAR